MVQLKGNRENIRRKSNVFQFLMVQLKVSLQLPEPSSTRISIPYGSIKSSAGYDCNFHLHEFQFLMVQLKGKQSSVYVQE